MDQKTITKILKETEAGYDQVAEKFSQTRKFFWRDLEFLGDYAKAGDKILDYGCGNGRLLELFLSKTRFSEIPKTEFWEYAGVDVSQKLIGIAKNKHGRENINFLKINSSQTSVPFKDDYFNVVYSIAVFHHLPSRELRNEIARDLFRVTKAGGHIIITVWNLWQWKYIKNIIMSYCHIFIYGSKLDRNDCYITFKNNQSEVFHRYHHAFTRNELKKLFRDAGFEIEKTTIVNKRNILLIGKK